VHRVSCEVPREALLWWGRLWRRTTYGRSASNNAGAIIGIATTFSNSLPQIITTMGFIQTATGAPKLFPLSRPTYQPGHFRVPYVNGDINSAGATVIQDLYVAPDGTITRIELGSCGDVNAQAINDHGVVVGSCTVPGQPISGFLELPF
jgi:hypothetical protein